MHQKALQIIQRYRWGCIIGLLAAILAYFLPLLEPVENWELATHNVRFQWRRERESKANIVLVLIQDSTLKAWPEPTVCWGVRYAQIVRNSMKNGAALIGFDTMPAVNMDRYLEDLGVQNNPAPIATFVEAIEEYPGKVVLSNIPGGKGVGLVEDLLLAEGIDNNVGYVNQEDETDKVRRTTTLITRIRDDASGRLIVGANFSTLLAARALNVDIHNLQEVRRMPRVPITNMDTVPFWINYTGMRFPVIRAEDLESGNLSTEQRSLLQGAIVLLGNDFSGAQDAFPVPDGAKYPGVEINANIVATLIDGAGLKRWDRELECWLTLGVSLGSLLLFLPFKFSRAFLFSLALACVWVVLCLYQFSAEKTLLPLVFPVLGMIVTQFLHHSVRSFEEFRQRSRIEAEFGRRVSPEIRDYLMLTDRKLDAQSEATILFLDIRGFTTYSQTREPSVVLNEVNELFSHIVPIIDKHKGLINKFTGDGLLAFFGVPFPQKNPAQAGVDAAIEIMIAIKNITRGDGQLWRVGISLNHGTVVHGDMGAGKRKEYTVLGDTVNTAARLEELNKQLESKIVLSQTTYDHLVNRPSLRGPVSMPVRGRSAISVYYLPEKEEEEVKNVSQPVQSHQIAG